MSNQIYILQHEEDVVLFLNQISALNAVIWSGDAFVHPEQIKADIVKKMSSPLCQLYTILPATEARLTLENGHELSRKIVGVEFLVCCKKNEFSRTYEVGRLRFVDNANNLPSVQMVELYKKLKAYIKKNYSYSPDSKIYLAPQFKQQYELGYLLATQLGRPVAF